MEGLEQVAEVLAPYLKKSAAEIADILKSDDGAAQTTQLLKDYQKSQYDRGYTVAEGKTKDVVEAALRKRGASDASFAELDNALDAVETAAAAKAGKAITDEDVLKHPAYKAAVTRIENEKMTAVAAAEKQAEAKLAADRAAFAKEQTSAQVATAAERILAELNPNLNPDPAKAAKQRARLIADLQGGQYKVENGEIKPVTAEGAYLPNAAGHPTSFADFVRSQVEEAGFDFPVSSPRQAPQLTPEEIAAGRGGALGFKEFKGAAPKTEEEYLKLANDPGQSAAAVDELRTYWKAQASG